MFLLAFLPGANSPQRKSIYYRRSKPFKRIISYDKVWHGYLAHLGELSSPYGPIEHKSYVRCPMYPLTEIYWLCSVPGSDKKKNQVRITDRTLSIPIFHLWCLHLICTLFYLAILCLTCPFLVPWRNHGFWTKPFSLSHSVLLTLPWKLTTNTNSFEMLNKTGLFHGPFLFSFALCSLIPCTMICANFLEWIE